MSEALARLDRSGNVDGVVLLHGISRTPRSFRKMQAAIEASGFTTLNLGYASRRKSLEALAEDIHPAIERFDDGLEGSIHFVGHSMGGLLVRVYLAKYRPQRLGRVVMLGTPNGGSEIADRLKDFAVIAPISGPAGQQADYKGSRRKRSSPPVDYPVGASSRETGSIDPISSRLFLPRTPLTA